MIRFMRVSRKLPSCRQCLHTLNSRELDIPEYNKKPLDPHILSLIKKYDPDIFYSSHVELNKKPLSFKQRNELILELGRAAVREEMEEAKSRQPSLLVDKLVKITKAKENEKEIEKPASIDQSSIVVNDAQKTENDEFKLRLAKSKLKILTEMGLRRSALEHELQSFPDNWMEDYETFDESDYLSDTQYGTPDPTIPISRVPCHGCGSMLQCADTNLPGYLPSELMRGQSGNVLQGLICQRCHFLKNYNTALKVKVNPEDYVNMISTIKDKKALAILMVDLVDFPCSLWPNMIEIIGEKRPVIVVGNKVDLLPQDSENYLNHITKSLETALVDAGLAKANIQHVCLISAQTNYGIEELITALYTIWPHKGDVYLLGNANVGKSTLFNALLRSDYCKIRARNLVRRATSSLWPGTTLRMLKFPIARPSNALLHERRKRLQGSQKEKQELEKLRKFQVHTGRTPETTLMDHIGLSYEVLPESKIENDIPLTDAPPKETWFNPNHAIFKTSKWLHDTPGVIQDEQTINLLTSEELLYTIPKQTLWPRSFHMLPGQTIFLAGLGRVDYIGGANSLRIAVFASEKLSILITSTKKAEEIYQESLGTELINVPRGDEKRIQDWPPLVRNKEKISVGNYHQSQTISVCDIVLSSAGWVTMNIPSSETAHFYAWTPDGRGIFIRKPALLPYAAELYRGKRNKFTASYKQKEPKQVFY